MTRNDSRKRCLTLVAGLLLASAGLQAQNCQALLLPYFRGDMTAMENYPTDKLDWRCMFASSAFFMSDTIPAGSEVHSITEVVDKWSREPLSADYSIDLETFSYYAYNFEEFHNTDRRGNLIFCFLTPGSAHRYLVMRPIDEVYRLTDALWNEKYD